jgi:hypothetical protein
LEEAAKEGESKARIKKWCKQKKEKNKNTEEERKRRKENVERRKDK